MIPLVLVVFAVLFVYFVWDMMKRPEQDQPINADGHDRSLER